MRYRYCETKIAGFKDTTMCALTGIISAELRISSPTLTFIRPARGYEKAYHEDDCDIGGLARWREGEVLVRAELGSRRMIQTLAHELRHMWQGKNCSWAFALPAGKERTERDADDYGLSWEYRVPIPRENAELCSGFGAPHYGWGQPFKDALPGGTELYYLDLYDGALWRTTSGFKEWRVPSSFRLAQLERRPPPPFN